MVICEGTPISFIYAAGRRLYAVVDLTYHLGDDGGLSAVNPKRFYYYRLDPLTNEIMPSLSEGDSTLIHAVEIVTGFPISEDYEIDSLACFFDCWLIKYKSWRRVDGQDPTTAKRFWTQFCGLLQSNASELLAQPYREFDSLRKSDFTELGIDLMRQHYRSLKADAVRSNGNISMECLEQLLHETRNHRTTDNDWIPLGFQHGAFVV